MDDQWLSVDAIAKYLGVCKDISFTWISSKNTPRHRFGWLWKFKKDEIDDRVRGGVAASGSTGSPEGEEH